MGELTNSMGMARVDKIKPAEAGQYAACFVYGVLTLIAILHVFRHTVGHGNYSSPVRANRTLSTAPAWQCQPEQSERIERHFVRG